MREIAVVCTQYGYAGGTGRVTTELMERFARDGDGVDVYCAKVDEGIREKTLVRSLNVLPLTKIGLLQHWHLIFKTGRAMRGKRYDIVYAAGALCRNPDIVTVHMLLEESRRLLDQMAKQGLVRQPYSPLKRFLRGIYCPLIYEMPEKWLYRNRRTKYICVSDGTKRAFEKQFPHCKAMTILNGVDADLMKPDPEARARLRAQYQIGPEEPVFCFVGSEWGRKHLDMAIDAVAKCPGAKLFIIGKEQDRQPYLRQAKALQCEERLIFAGFTRHVEQFYAASDYFLFPSCYETFGLVALEAMAAKLVVFSTRLYGTEDYIQNGVNGFLFEPGEQDKLNEQVAYALAHPDQMARVREAARETALKMSWENVYQEYRKAFQSKN